MFMLKEVQMTPCFLDRIVSLGTRQAVLWARKGISCFGKIKLDVQALFIRDEFC